MKLRLSKMNKITITASCFVIFFVFVSSFLMINDFKETKTTKLTGVFQTNEEDVDFSNELTGMLSEGVSDEYGAYAAAVAKVNQSGSNILRWGIARKPDNQAPDADPGAAELIAKYGGLYLGDTSKKIVYLTFDEGYENGYTSKILDVLKQNNVRAVFFITGPYLNKHQDLVERMVNEGHVVGNHTIHHPSLPNLSEAELEEEILGLDRAFKEKFGKSMTYLRPPKGEYNERTLSITQKLGYKNMFWSFAYDDWHRDKVRGADYATDIVLRNLHNGAIFLLHAVSKDNTDALDSIIKGARARGYEFGAFK